MGLRFSLRLTEDLARYLLGPNCGATFAMGPFLVVSKNHAGMEFAMRAPGWNDVQYDTSRHYHFSTHLNRIFDALR